MNSTHGSLSAIGKVQLVDYMLACQLSALVTGYLCFQDMVDDEV